MRQRLCWVHLKILSWIFREALYRLLCSCSSITPLCLSWAQRVKIVVESWLVNWLFRTMLLIEFINCNCCSENHIYFKLLFIFKIFLHSLRKLLLSLRICRYFFSSYTYVSPYYLLLSHSIPIGIWKMISYHWIFGYWRFRISYILSLLLLLHSEHMPELMSFIPLFTNFFSFQSQRLTSTDSRNWWTACGNDGKSPIVKCLKVDLWSN